MGRAHGRSGREVGDPGGTISERGSIRDTGSPSFVGRLPKAIAARLLIALERPVEHG